jgi:hypothetical protein
MKSVAWILVGLAMAVVAWPVPVFADGVYIPPETEATTSLSDITSPDQHVILVDRGDTQEMVVRVRVQGAPESFAWILPLPSAPLDPPQEFEDGDTLFAYLYEGSGPEWNEAEDAFSWSCAGAKAGDAGGEGSEPSVKLLGTAMVGNFKVDTLAAAKAQDLSDWLEQNGYQVPSQFAAMAQPYVDEKWVFLAMKLASEEKTDDRRLQVLHLKWAGTEPVFPMRLTAGNAAAGGTEVHLMVFSSHRMDVEGLDTRYAGKYPDEFWETWYTDISELDDEGAEQQFLQSLDGMWFTRLEGRFDSDEMTSDLRPVRADKDESYREQKLYVASNRSEEAGHGEPLAVLVLALTVAGVFVGLRALGRQGAAC